MYGIVVEMGKNNIFRARRSQNYKFSMGNALFHDCHIDFLTSYAKVLKPIIKS